MPKVHFTNRGEINERFAMLNFNGVVLEVPNVTQPFQWRLTSVRGDHYFCEGEASGALRLNSNDPDTTGCDADAVWQFNLVDGDQHADGWFCTACILEMLANGDMRVASGAIKVGSL